MNSDDSPMQHLMRHCSLGAWAEADRLCEAILGGEPRQRSLLLLSGEIALRRGDLPSARERLRRAAQAKVVDVEWLGRLSELTARAGDFESAAETLRYLLQLAPQNLGAL